MGCTVGATIDLTLLLPSTVFEADDTGRSYRLRPCTKSIWLRELTLKAGVLMFFLVPDGPGLAEAIRGTSAIVVTESKQTTNSWGLRGPEPDSMPLIAASCWATLTCRACSSGTMTLRPNASARSRKAMEVQGLDPQHRSPGLLARAILLFANCVCRPFPSAFRCSEHMFKRFWRWI